MGELGTKSKNSERGDDQRPDSAIHEAEEKNYRIPRGLAVEVTAQIKAVSDLLDEVEASIPEDLSEREMVVQSQVDLKALIRVVERLQEDA